MEHIDIIKQFHGYKNIEVLSEQLVEVILTYLQTDLDNAAQRCRYLYSSRRAFPLEEKLHRAENLLKRISYMADYISMRNDFKKLKHSFIVECNTFLNKPNTLWNDESFFTESFHKSLTFPGKINVEDIINKVMSNFISDQIKKKYLQELESINSFSIMRSQNFNSLINYVARLIPNAVLFDDVIGFLTKIVNAGENNIILMVFDHLIKNNNILLQRFPWKLKVIYCHLIIQVLHIITNFWGVTKKDKLKPIFEEFLYFLFNLKSDQLVIFVYIDDNAEWWKKLLLSFDFRKQVLNSDYYSHFLDQLFYLANESDNEGNNESKIYYRSQKTITQDTNHLPNKLNVHFFVASITLSLHYAELSKAIMNNVHFEKFLSSHITFIQQSPPLDYQTQKSMIRYITKLSAQNYLMSSTVFKLSIQDNIVKLPFALKVINNFLSFHQNWLSHSNITLITNTLLNSKFFYSTKHIQNYIFIAKNIFIRRLDIFAFSRLWNHLISNHPEHLKMHNGRLKLSKKRHEKIAMVNIINITTSVHKYQADYEDVNKFVRDNRINDVDNIHHVIYNFIGIHNICLKRALSVFEINEMRKLIIESPRSLVSLTTIEDNGKYSLLHLIPLLWNYFECISLLECKMFASELKKKLINEVEKEESPVLDLLAIAVHNVRVREWLIQSGLFNKISTMVHLKHVDSFCISVINFFKSSSLCSYTYKNELPQEVKCPSEYLSSSGWINLSIHCENILTDTQTICPSIIDHYCLDNDNVTLDKVVYLIRQNPDNHNLCNQIYDQIHNTSNGLKYDLTQLTENYQVIIEQASQTFNDNTDFWTFHEPHMIALLTHQYFYQFRITLDALQFPLFIIFQLMTMQAYVNVLPLPQLQQHILMSSLKDSKYQSLHFCALLLHLRPNFVKILHQNPSKAYITSSILPFNTDLTTFNFIDHYDTLTKIYCDKKLEN